MQADPTTNAASRRRQPTQSRNTPCPCDSGLRYKHCCGLDGTSSESAFARGDRKRHAALGWQQRGEFAQAIAAYDSILNEHPEDWDVAHMRATCLYQLGVMDEAAAAFATLLASPAANVSGFWTNLGLLLASVGADCSSPSLQHKLDAYRRFRPAGGALALPARPMPAVSVVMPAYMHADFAGEAVASVLAQTLLPLELIVIDDGSSDATAERCGDALRDAPFPVRLIRRENRGAAATLNEGIALARGEFIQLLNSDDRLPPQRIATMLGALVERDADWGYARVAFVDRHGQALRSSGNARAAALIAAADAALMSPTLGLSMLRANSAISSGNLMLRKRLWETVGGFADYRYNHDWDFCLRATLECEPVLVPKPLYEYRVHESNTIIEAENRARDELQQLMAAFVTRAQARSDWPNPFAPTLDNWGDTALATLGSIDALRHVPRTTIERALAAATARIDP